MQQVLHIHGGNPFSSREEFFTYWRAQEVESPFDAEEKKKWRSWLKEELSGEYSVGLLRMPNSMNAQYDEWKMWFEKHVPFFEDNIVLVGHSLGGNFLAKYLSENTLPITVASLHIVASPFGVATFSLPESLAQLQQQCASITLYYSTDDAIVPFAESLKYQNALPEAERVVFEDRNHFERQETFPELCDRIRATQ